MLTKGNMYKGIVDSIYKVFPCLKGFDIPKLIFSDEEPDTVVYGDLDPREIEYELDKTNREYRFDPHMRDNIRLLKGPEAKWILLQRMSSDCELTEEEKRYIEKAKRILARERLELTTGAYFDSNNNIIIVYTKAFDKYDQPEKDASIRRAIAHEMFHAVQHTISHSTYHEDSYYAGVVREALADFYSYVLCLDSDASNTDGMDINVCKNVAKRRCDFWRDYIFTYAPYPNAIFCMYRNGYIEHDTNYQDCINNGSIYKMKKVFDIAETSMYQAYLELVPEIFRKPPVRRTASGTGYSDSSRGFCPTGVKDYGLEEDFATLKCWEIIKKIITDYHIGSLEELQNYIPEDIVVFTRGRFVTLESGEILSAYPQWKIVDIKLFIDYAVELGILTRKEGREYLKKHIKTVVTLGLGPVWKSYDYLFDIDEADILNIGDKIVCINSEGSPVEACVKEKRYYSEAEYKSLCDSIGYKKLSKAKKVNPEDIDFPVMQGTPVFKIERRKRFKEIIMERKKASEEGDIDSLIPSSWPK